MEIKCGKCGQKYEIPDNKTGDRKRFFFCEKCDNKIIIDKKQSSSIYASESLDSRGRLRASDILEGVFHSFSIKNIIFSFILLAAYSLFALLLAGIAANNLKFFMEHIFFSGFLAFIILAVLVYFFDIHLYMIARNIENRILTGRDVYFSTIRSEILKDSKPVFFISTAPVILFAIIILPVYLLKVQFGFVYVSFLFVPLCALAVLIILFSKIKRMLYSFIARNTSRLGTYRKSIVTFLAVENINIAGYMLLSALVSAAAVFIAGGFIISAVVLTGLFSAASIAPVQFEMIQNTLSGLLSGGANYHGEGLREHSGAVKTGIVMLGISGWAILLLFVSYMISLYQSLMTVSVRIMEAAPGKSMNRPLILGVIGLAVFCFYVLIFAAGGLSL